MHIKKQLFSKRGGRHKWYKCIPEETRDGNVSVEQKSDRKKVNVKAKTAKGNEQWLGFTLSVFCWVVGVMTFVDDASSVCIPASSESLYLFPCLYPCVCVFECVDVWSDSEWEREVKRERDRVTEREREGVVQQWLPFLQKCSAASCPSGLLFHPCHWKSHYRDYVHNWLSVWMTDSAVLHYSQA